MHRISTRATAVLAVASSTPESSCSLIQTKGVIIGIAVGGGSAFLLIVGAFFMYWKLWRRESPKTSSQPRLFSRKPSRNAIIEPFTGAARHDETLAKLLHPAEEQFVTELLSLRRKENFSSEDLTRVVGRFIRERDVPMSELRSTTSAASPSSGFSPTSSFTPPPAKKARLPKPELRQQNLGSRQHS